MRLHIILNIVFALAVACLLQSVTANKVTDTSVSLPVPTSIAPPPTYGIPKHKNISRDQVNLAGFVAYVYGLEQLSQKHGKKPEVTVVIYMHGRYQDALASDDIVRDLYSHIRDLKKSETKKGRDFLIVSFDAQDHGSRLTDPLERSDLDVNPRFLYDHYAILLNNKDYASYIIDFLPTFLFPCGERNVTRWVAAGRSMGAHSTWHVLSGTYLMLTF